MNPFDIPEKFKNEKFIIYPDLLARVQDLYDFAIGKDPSWSFYLFGQTGIGKTHACCFVIQQFQKKRVNSAALFVKPATYLAQLQAHFNDHNGTINLLEKLHDVDLMIFDDFQKSDKSSEWQITKIADLLEERYDRQKKTIITSNLSLEEYVKKTEDARLGRRLSEGRVEPWKKSKYIENLKQIQMA